jgi:DNA-binding transcriptional regulator YhcF (GntR family)
MIKQHEPPLELAPFDVSIDRDAEVPIGVQLAWALRTGIHDGRFKPGQRLPALRELAEATGVNINTVKAVYQRLDKEGLIDSRQGSGTFVAPTRHRPSHTATIAANAANEAYESGVEPRAVAAALYVLPELSAQPTDAAAIRRRLLRKQIEMLERAIGELESEYPGVATPAAATRGVIGPTLLSAEELEHVRAQLVRRLAAIQDAIDGLPPSDGVLKPARPSARQPRPKRAGAATAKKRAGGPRPSTRVAPAGT